LPFGLRDKRGDCRSIETGALSLRGRRHSAHLYMSYDEEFEGRWSLGIIIAGIFLPPALVLVVFGLVWLFLLSTANARGLASAPFPQIKAAMENSPPMVASATGTIATVPGRRRGMPHGGDVQQGG
jgi:hypothetical protein